MAATFDELQPATPEPLWALIGEDQVVLENKEEGLAEELDGPLVGELTRVQDDVGENGSRLYTLDVDGVDRPVKLWGKAHIDSQVDDAGIEKGDTIGIRKTGGEIDVDQDSPMQEFEVRYEKA